MSIANQAVTVRHGSQIVTATTSVRPGKAMFIVGFHLREGGATQAHLLEWLHSVAASQLMPGLWQFGGEAERLDEFVDLLLGTLEVEAAEDSRYDETIVISAAGHLVVLKKTLAAFENSEQSQDPGSNARGSVIAQTDPLGDIDRTRKPLGPNGLPIEVPVATTRSSRGPKLPGARSAPSPETPDSTG